MIVNLNNRLLKITKIKTNSLLLVLFMVPPISFIYFYALVVALSERINRNTFWPMILFALLFFGTSLLLLNYFMGFSLLENHFDVIYLNGIYIFLGLLLLILVIYATVLSVSYERQINVEHFHLSTDMDFLGRFFILLFLPLTIWLYHPILISYFTPADSE